MKKVIKNKTLRTICYVLVGVLIVGALVGLVSLFTKKAEETTKSISPSYAVGGLTANGKFEDNKGSIYTKNAFECYGLKTTIDFDNNISYKLFFYDEDNDFISSTSTLTANYNSADDLMPYGTKYCRIVITPNEDESISWFEISKYAKQLDIQVNKDQNKIKNVVVYSPLSIDASKHNKVIDETGYVASSFAYDTDFSTRIVCGGNSKLNLLVSGNANEYSMVVFNYDETSTLGDDDYSLVSCSTFSSCYGGYTYTFDIPENATSLRILLPTEYFATAGYTLA